jgi:hypothetical protein
LRSSVLLAGGLIGAEPATEQKRAVAELFMTELGPFGHWPVA